MLSYPVTEQAGGPGVAASGFAKHLAALGADVHLCAADYGHFTNWLVSQRTAADGGYRFTRLPAGGFARSLAGFLRELSWRARRDHPRVIWANGIWGPQSVAGAALSAWGSPLVIRPAGSLGFAALRYRALKKKLYFRAVESHTIARARKIHCMSQREIDELPPGLRERSFIVPSGVDLALSEPPLDAPDDLVGVLARLHPIKRHHAVLNAVEALAATGKPLRVEFAGSVSDTGYEEDLRSRIQKSPALRGRVTLLGHVERSRLPLIVGRWRAALLLSEQENFGHSVLAAAAAGVPSVVTTGVGLSTALQQAGAGVITEPQQADRALMAVLRSPRGHWFERCQSFAAQYSWRACAQQLLSQLEQITAH